MYFKIFFVYLQAFATNGVLCINPIAPNFTKRRVLDQANPPFEGLVISVCKSLAFSICSAAPIT